MPVSYLLRHVETDRQTGRQTHTQRHPFMRETETVNETREL